MAALADTAAPAVMAAIDWAAFDRRARRVAVAKVPLVPVRVAFHPDGLVEPTLIVSWQGQVYDALAVCRVGRSPGQEPPPPGYRHYQLVHVPTGLYLRSRAQAHPLRALALALADTGIDWSGVGSSGLADLPEGQRKGAQDVVRSWGDTYAR